MKTAQKVTLIKITKKKIILWIIAAESCKYELTGFVDGGH